MVKVNLEKRIRPYICGWREYLIYVHDILKNNYCFCEVIRLHTKKYKLIVLVCVKVLLSAWIELMVWLNAVDIKTKSKVLPASVRGQTELQPHSS